MLLADSVQSLIDRATRLADGQPIKLIRATLGELTGLTPAEVQGEFKRRRGETPAAGAQLELRLEPARVICLSCEQPVPTQADGEACQACGSYRRQVMAGQLMAVEGVSIDRSPRAARRAVPRGPSSRRASVSSLAGKGDWDE